MSRYGGVYPKKLNTKKCSTIEPRAKSANALQCGVSGQGAWRVIEREGAHLSGEISLNSERFSGLTCERRLAVSTNCPTVLPKLP